MKIRHAGIALVALLLTLAGCRVSVMLADYAPGSLDGQTLILTSDSFGGPLAEYPDSLVYAVPIRVTYHFKDASRAFDSALNRALSWSYRIDSYSTGTVSVTFAWDGRSDLIAACRLSFQGYDHGTHRCEVTIVETRTMLRETTQSGWGEGTFLLERLE